MSTTDIIVIDVSHWQGKWPGPDTPWQAMAGAGIVGAILKATEGPSYVDDTFAARYAACRENDVAVCGYHFLRPGSMPQQMDHFLNVVEPVQGERMVLDWEDDGVHVGDIQYCVKYLLDKRPDLQITIYASSSFLQENVPNVSDPVLAQTSLWVARYSDSPPYWPSAVWPTWSLWQCTDSFEIEGYGPLDGNKFNGSVEACMVWLNPVAVEPAPLPPEPVVEVHHIDIRVNGPIAIFVDGVEIELP